MAFTNEETVYWVSPVISGYGKGAVAKAERSQVSRNAQLRGGRRTLLGEQICREGCAARGTALGDMAGTKPGVGRAVSEGT